MSEDKPIINNPYITIDGEVPPLPVSPINKSLEKLAYVAGMFVGVIVYLLLAHL
jgi:hypothetical protein